MKVGYVLECGPDGADMKVLRHLTSMINPEAEFDYEALSVKTVLLRDSGKAAKRLIGAGCDKIFIVWDLFPAWREDKGKPCRHEDKETIKSSLAAHQIPENNIHLLCIEEELESWIIADGRALSRFLSKPHRQVNIDSQKNPDRIKDPKGILWYSPKLGQRIKV